MTVSEKEQIEEIKKNAPKLIDKRDPLIRTVLQKFDFSNPPLHPTEVAYMLCDTMLVNNGIGLAANQIGIPYRIFAMRTEPMVVCFNPKIVDKSTKESVMDEGCLTFPGFFVKVSRADIIKVRYTEPNGQTVTKKFSGMTARIFQHELDHLDGKLFTDNINRTVLALAMKKANKRGFKYTAQDFYNGVTTVSR